MINTLIGEVFGTKNERVVKSMMPNVLAINALEPQMQKLSDEELRAKTDEFRQRIQERLSHFTAAALAPEAEADGDSDPDRAKQLEKEQYDTLQEVLDEILGKLRIPVLSGLTFGHTDDQLTLPLGVMAALDADKGELVIEEAGVR